ncbi:MAG: DUF3299 domain-containing protein [Saprospiraceae bacterium]|nr:DUF3299 domain-containing protein [Saprospiraceae bacterium]
MNRLFLFALLALLLSSACQSGSDNPSTEPNPDTIPPNKPLSVKDTLAIDSVTFDSSQYTFADDAILVDWDLLNNVAFNETYNDEVQAYIPYPEFEPIVQALDGKTIIVEGYIIPVEETGEQSILVLSANPFSSCFFCGGAGPETVMDVKLKKPRKMKTDERIQFKGQLKLNSTDLYYLNYILEEAEEI